MSPNLPDKKLAEQLISTQFPQWSNLPIEPILPGGWDNRCFRLGDYMLIRLPSASVYANNVEKEQKWLPQLSSHLSVGIPQPLVMGKPCDMYPRHWSVYRWIPGDVLADVVQINTLELAKDLAVFLKSLESIDTAGGPVSGKHNFYRGGSLSVYDTQVREAVQCLANSITADDAITIWEMAISSHWDRLPVWVHGDISAGNILVRNGKLAAIIDFGGLCIGDPACDFAIAWTYFDAVSRRVFKEAINVDESTWLRGRAWALWKALIIEAEVTDSNAVEKSQALRTLREILYEN